MRTQTFTSTISPEIIAWVDKLAHEKKKTRRAILEEAVLSYKRTLRSQNLLEAFKQAAHDPDIVEMAEWGMEDYARSLRSTDA